jgi:hypothetical protein
MEKKIRNLTLEPPCFLRTDSVRRKFVERNSVFTVAIFIIINLLVQTIFHTKRISMFLVSLRTEFNKPKAVVL